MFCECIKCTPNLKCPLVTDKEQAMVDAAKSLLPEISLVHVHCWNHFFQNIRLWVIKHSVLSYDIAVYSNDVLNLFQAESEEKYEQLLDQFRQDWDTDFEQYYLQHIHPNAGHSIGRWVLESVHVYNPYSGVMNNQSEGLNQVMKELQD